MRFGQNSLPESRGRKRRYRRNSYRLRARRSLRKKQGALETEIRERRTKNRAQTVAYEKSKSIKTSKSQDSSFAIIREILGAGSRTLSPRTMPRWLVRPRSHDFPRR